MKELLKKQGFKWASEIPILSNRFTKYNIHEIQPPFDQFGLVH